jgi:hypothetical protein
VSEYLQARYNGTEIYTLVGIGSCVTFWKVPTGNIWEVIGSYPFDQSFPTNGPNEFEAQEAERLTSTEVLRWFQGAGVQWEVLHEGSWVSPDKESADRAAAEQSKAEAARVAAEEAKAKARAEAEAREAERLKDLNNLRESELLSMITGSSDPEHLMKIAKVAHSKGWSETYRKAFDKACANV